MFEADILVAQNPAMAAKIQANDKADVDKGEDHKKPASESRFNTYSYSGIEKVDENGVSD